MNHAQRGNHQNQRLEKKTGEMYLISIPDRSSSGQAGKQIEIHMGGALKTELPLFSKIVN